jgi:hypothetical protein
VETALEATTRHGRWMGRKRGAGRSSPSGKTKTRAARSDGDTEETDGTPATCGVGNCGSSEWKWSEEGQQRERRRVRLPFKRGQARGDAPTMGGSWARGGGRRLRLRPRKRAEVGEERRQVGPGCQPLREGWKGAGGNGCQR